MTKAASAAFFFPFIRKTVRRTSIFKEECTPRLHTDTYD